MGKPRTRSTADAGSILEITVRLTGFSVGDVRPIDANTHGPHIKIKDTGLVKEPVFQREIEDPEDARSAAVAALNLLESLRHSNPLELLAQYEAFLDSRIDEWANKNAADEDSKASPSSPKGGYDDAVTAKRLLEYLRKNVPGKSIEHACSWIRLGRLIERIEYVRPGEQKLRDGRRKLARTNKPVVAFIRYFRNPDHGAKPLSDQQIAMKLTAKGIKKRGGQPWNKGDISSYRRKHNIK